MLGATPILTAALLTVFAASRTAVGRTTFYVDGDIGSSGNGLSRASPRKTLREALSDAIGGGPHEIWVRGDNDADGIVYYPDDGGSSNLRTETFALISGVAIYGGFEGDEMDRNERDPAVYITVLSGDLQQNDTASFGNYGDNAYHVVSAGGVDETAILDGFTIRAGNADGVNLDQTTGGGIACVDCEARIRNCIIAWNSAKSSGGGMFIAQASTTSAPNVRRAQFHNNRASNNTSSVGGAVYAGEDPSPVFSICSFRDNTSSGDGGAVGTFLSEAFFASCEFEENDAGSGRDGGAVIIEDENGDAPGPVSFVNCLFIHNGEAGTAQGGAMAVFDRAEIHLCTFADNEASSFGGAVFHKSDEDSVISSSILWFNNAQDGGQVCHVSGTLRIGNSNVQGGESAAEECGEVDWENSINADPKLRYRSSPTRNYRLQPTSPSIDSENADPLPDDQGALDSDGNEAEDTPRDRDIEVRVVNGDVDMGAFEYQGGSCDADCGATEDCQVSVEDLLKLLEQWDGTGSCNIVNPGSSVVNVSDLLALLAEFGNCTACGGPAAATSIDVAVQDCLELSTTAAQIECIETLCANEELPPEDCPD
jgi:hypothetical protein